MSTTDSTLPVTQGATPASQTPAPQDEFDFGITGASAVEESLPPVENSDVASLMSEEDSAVSAQESTPVQDFDFSLDLPDQYGSSASSGEPSVSLHEENVAVEPATSLEAQSDISEGAPVALMDDVPSSPVEGVVAEQNLADEVTLDLTSV